MIMSVEKKTSVQLFYAALMFGGMVLSFAKWILFSKILLPADFGIYSTLMSSIALAAYIGGFGLNEYIIQQGSNSHGKGMYFEIYAIRNQAIVIGTIVSTLLLVPILLISYWIDGLGLDIWHYLLLSCVLVSTVVFGVVDASLRAAQRTLAFAGMVFLRAIFLLVAGYVLANEVGLPGIFMAEFASASAAIIVAIFVLGPKPDSIGNGLSRTIMKAFLLKGFSFLKVQLLRYLSLAIDKWLIGWFLGVVALGQYSFLLITFLAFTAFAGVYNAVLIPKIISLFSKNKDKKYLINTTNKQANFFITGSIVLCPFYIFSASLVMSSFFAEYAFNHLAISMSLIYLGSAFHVATQFFDSLFYSLSKQAELSVMAAINLILLAAYYLIAGFFMPSVLFFCFAFFLSKISWFLITKIRVSQIDKILFITN